MKWYGLSTTTILFLCNNDYRIGCFHMCTQAPILYILPYFNAKLFTQSNKFQEYYQMKNIFRKDVFELNEPMRGIFIYLLN